MPTVAPYVLLAALAPPVPQDADIDVESGFEVVHRALAGSQIEFVHFESLHPNLVLGVYSGDERIATWPKNAPPKAAELALPPNQRFVTDALLDLTLVIRSIDYACLTGNGTSGLARSTKVEFPLGLPEPLLPGLPPLPTPEPPPPVEGACVLHVSSDASLLAYVRSRLEPGLTREVTLFRRAEPGSGVFALSGDYSLRDAGGISPGHAELQLDAEGRLLAQRDGHELVLRDNRANQIERWDLSGPFALSQEGLWLARGTPQGVDFHELSDTGAPTGLRTSFATATRPLEVRLRGERALVRERATVSLVDVRRGAGLWSRSTTEGTWVSMDLRLHDDGSVLVGLGRRAVSRPPARREGSPVAGEASATIAVYDAASEQELIETDFPLTDWRYDTPRVRFAPSHARLAVVAPELALISRELP